MNSDIVQVLRKRKKRYVSPSGVGIQTKLFCEALLKSGKYCIRQLGGAIRHQSYAPIKLEPYGDDFIILPVDSYGTKDQVRSIIRQERPDAMWIMTDPRFWIWLWEMDNEIRQQMPITYYHVWDNLPLPKFNRKYYESNDKIVTISKLTDHIVRNVAPDVDCTYLPHSVNSDVFKPLPEIEIQKFRKESLAASGQPQNADKFIFFFNSRNARRKMSGSLIYWFNDFLNVVGRDKAALILHTDPHDENGPDLEAITEDFGLTNGSVMFSRGKVNTDILVKIYNMVDCGILLSDNEGFGLSTIESLSCGTPAIVTMTGGLQEQITDGKDFFGVGIEPASKAIIGSQSVPYIYETRLNGKDVVNAMLKMYNMSKEERKKLGELGRQHILKNYNFANFEKRWVEIMDEVIEKHGSWSTRKNYKAWGIKEIK